MNRWTRLTAIAALGGMMALNLSGCAGPQVQDYAQEQPRLDLRQYFNGPVRAHGVFTDRQGRVVKRFVVDMQATWQGNQGTLDERFTYSDGTKQQRVWHLTDHGQGRYSGRADDVVGEASGEAAGNALRWGYTLALPVDGRVWHVQFDDWMFLVDDKTMINKAVMSKFGIRLGEVTLSFTRL
ncbi:DUF3833 domain-containing protein [Aquabacterium sp.]|uniref:DUF3833 domain-containing protein n=1 Tax=Aquabacterium sp. TaxID=1872578 RepID=UPI002E330E94|nr:DUF3833 domain-containing protein [Aquabacterium sp.]HEX5312761.1 DUF3833 domain-containing protein [Aquabacterium sp.]